MNKIKSILAFAALLLCGGVWAVEAPIPNVIWDGDFGTYMKVGTDGRTYKFALGSNTSQNNGASVKVSNATAPYITLPSGFGHTITVIIKYSSYTAPSSKTAMMFINEPTGNGIGVYSDGSQIAGFQNQSDGYGKKDKIMPESGYLTMSYESESSSPPCGTWGYPGSLNATTGKIVCDNNANYGANGLRYTQTGRVLDTCNVYLGGSSGATGKHPSMQNLVIEKVAIFNSWLSKDQIETYEFKPVLMDQTAYASLSDALTAAGTPADAAAAKTIHLLKGVAENAELKEYVTLDTHGTAYTGVVSGDGTVIFRGDSDTSSGAATVFNNLENINQAQKNGFKNTTAWHGTVVLDGYGRLWGPNSGDYGHANSVVQFTGCKGWIATNTHAAPIKLVDATDGSKALTINNGSSATAVTINKLLGDGTLYSDSNTATQKIKVIDGSEFRGSITMQTGKGVCFGTSIKTDGTDHNKVIIDSDKSATLAQGKTWTAGGGIYVNGTLAGTGTFAGNVTFGSTATIDISANEEGAALTLGANKSVTFGGTLNLVGAQNGSVILKGVASEPANLNMVAMKLNGAATTDGHLEYNADDHTIVYATTEVVAWTPNLDKEGVVVDGIFDWTATAAWKDASGADQSWTWTDDNAEGAPNVKFDAKNIKGVKISGKINVGEVLLVNTADEAKPFDFHNHTLGVGKDPATGKDTTTDAETDCLTASAILMTTYNGKLGLKVPINGLIGLGDDTDLTFKTGEAGGDASTAYAYAFGRVVTISVEGSGEFAVPAEMYGIPFAPESTASIVFNKAGTVTATSAGAGKAIVRGATVVFTAPINCASGLWIEENATAEFTTPVGSSTPVKGTGVLKYTQANGGVSTLLFNWFAASAFNEFTGTLELNKGRFESNTALAQNVKIKIDADTQFWPTGSSVFNNYIYVSGNGWTTETQYAMSKAAIRLDGSVGSEGTLDFGDALASIGTYNNDKEIAATIKGSAGFGIISDNARTFTFKAAKMTELTGEVVMRPNNTGNQNLTMVLDTEANDVTIGFTVAAANGTVKKTGSGTLTLPDGFNRAIVLAEGVIVSPRADLAVTGLNGATVYKGTAKGKTTYFLTAPKGWRVKDGVAVTTAEYYSRWSNTANSAGIINLKTTSNSTAGQLHNQTVKPFDSATDTESAAWTGNWYLNLARGQSGYVAPGYTIRFASDITGTNKALDASFTPMSYSGIIVEPGAAGFSFVSWSSNSDRKTELGSTGASTSSMIGEDFGIFRNKPTTIFGMHEIEIAEGKTLHINDGSAGGHDYSGAAYKTIIESGATLKLVGAGKLSVGTLDASSATIDLSSIGSTEAAFIQGTVTVDASTKICFPAEWTEGTAMKLCSGTISGPATSSAVAIRVGDEIKLATLTYADGAVSYAESDDPSVWVVSSEGDTKEITGDTTLSTVILNGTGKITGTGVITIGDATAGQNGKLILGAGITLSMSTIQVPDYLVLEAGAKISGTAVPNFAGQTIKIDGSTMEADHSYDLVEWSDFMYNQFSYGNPTIEIVGGCQYAYDVVPLVHKVAIRVHSAAEAARRPLRIWCVGDSITEGYNGGASCANYRVQLAGKLTLDGYNVQMVGFHQHRSFLPNGEWAPDKWAWHSGVSAQRVWTQTAGGGSNARAGYAEAIDAAMYQVGEADMVLIKLATNDIGQSDSADHIFEGLQEIVARVMKGMPMAKVALATTVWFNDNTGITPVSEKVRAWVATKPYGDRLVLADLNEAMPSKLDSEGRLLFWTDNVHPNWNGHDTMSDVWKQAVETAYPSASYEPAAPTGKTIAHGAKANVAPEYTKGFVLNRSLAIPEKASYTMDGTTRAPEYAMGTASTGATKVGYYLELVRPATAFRPEELRYVWVDMEIPAGKTLDDMLVPTGATLQGVVDKLHVTSNMGSVTTVPADVDTVKGFLEFSPYTATSGAKNTAGFPAALWGAMDWNDTLPTSGAAGLGCMQVHRVFSAGEDNPLHNRNGGETIFAWNNWGEANAEGTAHENARAGEIGIGNFAQHYMTSTETNGQSDTRRRGQGSQINAAIPGAGVEIDNNHVSSDYTTTRFSPFGDTMNAKAYSVRNLEIWVYDPTLLPNVIVGSNEYSTLDAAITAAQEGDVIEIVNDISAETIALTKNVMITTFKGADVTVAATFTGAHKLTKVGKGKLSLTGSNAFNAFDIQDGAVEMTSASAMAAGATLDGSGRVIFNGFLPVDNNGKNPTITIANTWTGTVEMKNYSHPTNANIIYFGKFANANSTVALNSVTATTFTGKNNHDDQEFGTLEIMEGGWTTTTGNYSIDPKYTCNLTGSGTINVKQGSTGTINFIGDHSKFSGSIKITAGDKAVVLSPVGAGKVTGKTNQSITIAEDAVVGGSGTWTASAGIVVNGTILTANGFAPDANTAVTGSGRVVFNEWLPATNAKIVTEIKKAEFTGMTEIRNYEHTSDSNRIINLQAYASSEGIALNGVTMTAYTGNATYPDQTLKTLEILEGGWQTSTLRFTGNCPKYTTALKGNGKITIRQPGNGTINFNGDHSGFTGAIAMVGTDKGVVLNKASTAKVSATDTAMTVTTDLDGYQLICNEIGAVKEYRLMQVDGDVPEVVIPEGTTTVTLVPGQEPTVPQTVTVENIKVVYNGVELTKADAETSRPKYVNVTINAETGKVELATTEAAKPEAVKIKMTLPKEGEGEGAKDKVSFTITDPIPGLFYSIVSANGPTDADFTTGDDSTGTQATGGESTTTSIDMPTDAKVKYFRVRVKATK